MFSDELISAYLDGELSAEERSQVEQALREHSELRTLLEELREQRGRFDGLPRHKLRTGLADRVLRRAERIMLSASAAPEQAAAAPQPSPAADVVRPYRTSGRPRNIRRRLWVSAAAAAALLIAVVTSQTKRTPVAERPEAARPASSPASPEMVGAANERLPEREAVLEEIEAAPERAEQDTDARLAASKSAAARGRGEIAAGEPVLKGGGGVGLSSADKRLGQVGGLARDEPIPSHEKILAFGARDAPAESGGLLERQQDVISQLQNSGDFVVRVDATREALQQRRFDATLAANQIVFHTETPLKTDELKTSPNKPAAVGEVAAAQEAGDVQVVVVEAAPEQIAGALSDLTKQQSEFPAVLALDTGRDVQESFWKFTQSQSSSVQASPSELLYGRQRAADPQTRRSGGQSFGAAAPAPQRTGQSPGQDGAKDKSVGDRKEQLKKQMGRATLNAARTEAAARPAEEQAAPGRREKGVSREPAQSQPSGVARRIPAPPPLVSQNLAPAAGRPPEPSLAGAPADRFGPLRSVRLYFVIRAVDAHAAASTVKKRNAAPAK